MLGGLASHEPALVTRDARERPGRWVSVPRSWQIRRHGFRPIIWIDDTTCLRAQLRLMSRHGVWCILRPSDVRESLYWWCTGLYCYSWGIARHIPCVRDAGVWFVCSERSLCSVEVLQRHHFRGVMVRICIATGTGFSGCIMALLHLSHP